MLTFSEFLVENLSSEADVKRFITKKFGNVEIKTTSSKNRIVITFYANIKDSDRKAELLKLSTEIPNATFVEKSSLSRGAGHIEINTNGTPIFLVAKVAKKSSAKLDPTKFEGNLIYSLVKLSGGDFNSIKKSVSSHFIDSPEAISISDDIAKTLIQTTGKISQGYLPSAARLSKIYISYGVTSTTPKTDIVLRGSSLMKVTVKKSGAHQYVAAQAPEMSAIYASVLEKMPDIDSTKIITLINQTLQPQIFYKLRDHLSDNKSDFQKHIASVLGLGGQKIENFNEKANALLQNNKIREEIMKDIDAYKPTIADEIAFEYNKNNNLGYDLSTENQTKSSLRKKYIEIKKIMEKNYEDALKAMINKGFVSITEEMTEILSSKKVKFEILKEGVTGNNKFVTDDSIPTHALLWNDKNPNSSEFFAITDSWLNKKLSEVNIDINDRGSGRGGSFRLRESIDYDNLISKCIEETNNDTTVLHLLSETIKNNILKDHQHLLTEINLLSLAKNYLVSAKNFLVDVVGFISKIIAKIVLFVKNLMTKSKSSIARVFNIWIQPKPLIISLSK